MAVFSWRAQRSGKARLSRIHQSKRGSHRLGTPVAGAPSKVGDSGVDVFDAASHHIQLLHASEAGGIIGNGWTAETLRLQATWPAHRWFTAFGTPAMSLFAQTRNPQRPSS